MIKTSVLCVCSMFSLNNMVAESMPLNHAENTTVIQPGVPENNGVNSLLLKNHSNEILDLWFGPLGGPDFYPAHKASTWFSKTL